MFFPIIGRSVSLSEFCFIKSTCELIEFIFLKLTEDDSLSLTDLSASFLLSALNPKNYIGNIMKIKSAASLFKVKAIAIVAIIVARFINKSGKTPA